MSYEIPIPTVEKLREKPILNAYELHKYITEKLGVEPLSVSVDNINAKVRVYFERELNENDRKKLYVVVNDYCKVHLEV